MAQVTRDLSLPPPYDTPMLPPTVNPTLPPPSGQRYLPGTGGPYGEPERRPSAGRGAPTASGGGSGLRADVRLSEARAKPAQIDRLADLVPYLHSCWLGPAALSATRLDATIRFSVTRTGALAGEPRVTYVSRQASAEQREAIIVALRATLARCAPLPLTDRFGAAIAGRPMSIRFILNAPSSGA